MLQDDEELDGEVDRFDLEVYQIIGVSTKPLKSNG
jgi:hypothetical protein